MLIVLRSHLLVCMEESFCRRASSECKAKHNDYVIILLHYIM